MRARFLCCWIVLLAACQSPAVPGAACARSSECASPLTCSFGRCRASCVQNRDCPTGSSCLTSPTGNVCTVDTDLGCETGVGRMCPSGLVCVGDRCAATCAGMTDCPADGECRESTTAGISFCFDARNPPADAGRPIDASPVDAGAVDAGLDAPSAQDDAFVSPDTAVDAFQPGMDASVTGCAAVCIQGGDGTIGERACAICMGYVFCWGTDEDDGLGEGDGVTPPGRPHLVVDARGMPLSGVGLIACGARHACAALPDHSIACWGSDPAGHGTLGGLASSDHAESMGLGLTRTATPQLLGAGAYHTLVSFGLPANEVRCFGDNAQGACDASLTYVSATPTGPHPLLTAERPFGGVFVGALLGGGWARSCYVDGASGAMHCAGLSEQGVAGPTVATRICQSSATTTLIPTPTQAIAFGRYHTCFLASQRAYCLGGNRFDALGTSATLTGCTSDCTDTPVPVQGGATDFILIGSGPTSSHTCAAHNTGIACWGRDEHGQCGGSSARASRPVPVDVGGITDEVTAIATGSESTCVATQSGEIWCWGSNEWGQLGQGTVGGMSLVPVRVLP